MFRVKGMKIVESFQTLINPMRSIPPFIIGLTGITEEMVESAPPASEVMPAVRDFIGSTVLVAHYTPFDVPFLSHYIRKATGSTLRNQTLCTCRLARRILPHLRSKGLTSVADYFGIHVENRHRAAGDALATAKILILFLAHLMDRGVETLGEVLRLQYGPIHPRLAIQPTFKAR
jgi:DNA polymerase-3 subunit epsilon